MEHLSEAVNNALVKLCDALCSWERDTSRTSALILREKGGFIFRASSGRPVTDNMISDAQLVKVEVWD